ncbi:diguanylate cyclase [Vandammella animalimorsus]|uniref:Diguanylate cyclase n=1 Tax=Vandammella animalimorsus TaxID=2029117 RepID=A0A2A2AE89_9BURK|nr:PAS domain-containing protein [Vandammella animalimorsus]RRD68318.1 PAS domain S-box protein [Comamonadaceae bacterium OH2310_COT-174]PAT30983.1 diguanylate cyclase [Vandammella animalimorsus]PAT36126.1 diguanylate cyclase [Vandammella animalimorsus]PAX18291.1 diguanylate cyclase [Vandammella animalimorsus]PAX20454.1 diguanylate cyclase [Vandammella animalimorsus]
MAFPPMQPADDAQQTHTLHFHDGSSRTVQVSQREIPYPDGRLIISRTDLQGIITHANEAFVELSGYTREELIGQPHCVLRHPDMPRAAFKDLWDTVAAGKKWHGYVKNLRKDGAHYWVYATAVPNVRNGQIVGYTSVRRKPSRKKIAEMSALYQQWLAAEGSAS